MRIVLSGPPSVGKSTQGRIASELLGVPHVSSGALIRDRASLGNPEAMTLLRQVSDGSLAPSDAITAMVLERLFHPDCASGFILDGFPRKPEEASSLVAAFAHQQIDAFIVLDASTNLLMERVRSRAAYGGRADDDPAVFPTRITVYNNQTEGVAGILRDCDVPVLRIDAEPDHNTVAETIRVALETLSDTLTRARMVV